MKYTKVILTEKTLGLVFDRISKMMKSGIVLCDSVYLELNLNALNKNLDSNFEVKYLKDRQDAMLHKKMQRRGNYYNQPSICIEPSREGNAGTVVNFGDTIYFGKDEIRIKSESKHRVDRLRLLIRPPYDNNGPIWSSFIKAEERERLDAEMFEEILGDISDEDLEEDYSDEDHLYN